jgi:4-cresol dehydrogenase (hydroxylating) flavoprotein subunit
MRIWTLWRGDRLSWRCSSRIGALRSRDPPQTSTPARDGCGLLWYAPLVPMNGETARRTVDMVRRVCKDHAIEPLITLTSLSDRCFDMTVPILFPQHDGERTADADRCFRQLFRDGREIGVAPYRMGVEAMTLLVEPSPYWRTVSAIKQAIDPHQIMAPGRYSNCKLPPATSIRPPVRLVDEELGRRGDGPVARHATSHDRRW